MHLLKRDERTGESERTVCLKIEGVIVSGSVDFLESIEFIAAVT